MTYEELNMGQGGDITDVHNLVDFIVSELIKVFSVCLLCYFSFTFLVLKWIKLSNIQFGKGVLVCLGCFNKNTVDWRAYQFSSVAQSSPTLCDPMDCSMPGLPVHHQLLKFTQTHIHRVSDAIQPSHPLSSPSPPALSFSQHQGLFQWVSSSHQVPRVLELPLQHQSF